MRARSYVWPRLHDVLSHSRNATHDKDKRVLSGTLSCLCDKKSFEKFFLQSRQDFHSDDSMQLKSNWMNFDSRITSYMLTLCYQFIDPGQGTRIESKCKELLNTQSTLLNWVFHLIRIELAMTWILAILKTRIVTSCIACNKWHQIKDDELECIEQFCLSWFYSRKILVRWELGFNRELSLRPIKGFLVIKSSYATSFTFQAGKTFSHLFASLDFLVCSWIKSIEF